MHAQSRLFRTEGADSYMGNNGMGRVQATNKQTESKRELWRQYREGLYLQVKVERPELTVDKAVLFIRLNQ